MISLKHVEGGKGGDNDWTNLIKIYMHGVSKRKNKNHDTVYENTSEIINE